MKINNINGNLESIFSEHPTPFAIVYRPKVDNKTINVFTGDITTYDTLDDIPFDPFNYKQNKPYDVLALIPFKQIKERGFEYVDDETPLVVMKIKQQMTEEKTKILEMIENHNLFMENEHYSSSDEEYKNLVDSIISNEINNGVGANFVLKRTYLANIKEYSIKKALSIFKRLLSMESGSYWTFIIYTGKRVLVGATPECHIRLSNQIATMNPISGTYRYKNSKSIVNDFLEFLSDTKEIEELYMVVDEELKMISRVCQDEISLEGPYIREMANLAHTEYFIKGKTNLSAQQILKETLFAPTVTGSPLENACRVIKKYEPEGRGYYSGVIALFGSDSNSRATLDSAILIRTADICDKGKLKITVGSTIVRHSQPELENLETKAKASGLLKAIENKSNNPKIVPLKSTLKDNPKVITILNERNQFLSEFWLPNKKLRSHRPTLKKLKTLIIDAEDTFTSMLYHILKSFDLEVDLKKFDEPFDINNYQLHILGPGPGDPRDNADNRVLTIKNIIKTLIKRKSPFLAVCLSHQILCLDLGLPVFLKEKPNQGTQKEINLFGSKEKVGFYNSFSGVFPNNVYIAKECGLVEISNDIETNEIYALRNENFYSMQFHPESILTQRGTEILEKSLLNILRNNKELTFTTNTLAG